MTPATHSAESQLSPSVVLVTSPEFVLIPVEEGYIVDGGRQLEIISGPAALSTLPVILPLIDGVRSLGEIEALCPHVKQNRIEEAVKQLLSWGALSAKQERPAWPISMRNTLAFLKRSDVKVDLKAAKSVLTDTRVIIICDEDSRKMAHNLAEVMKMNGFIQVFAESHPEPACSGVEGDLVVSLLTNSCSTSLTRQHYTRVLGMGRRWLRVNLSDEFLEVGPIFTADTNLCLACLSRGEFSDGSIALSLGKVTNSAWSAIIASEATTLLLFPNAESRAFRRYRLHTFAYEVKTWQIEACCSLRHDNGDGCSLSGLASAPGGGRQKLSLPLLYEEAIASRQDSSESDMVAISQSATTKRFLNSASTPLPIMKLGLPQRLLDLLLFMPKGRKVALKLEMIAQLLSLSVGVKSHAGDSVRRWAPSGGNLGSTQAYLVASQVEGLASGVYFYQPEEHTLKRLNQRNVRHLDAFRAAVYGREDPAAIIVFSGAYRRIARKYGPFAYKLMHLDAGAASSQLLLTASALKTEVRSAEAWDAEALGKALDLRPQEEVPIQIFCLGLRKQLIAKQTKPSIGAMMGGLSSHSNLLHSAESSPETLVDELIVDRPYVHSPLPPLIGPVKLLSMERYRSSLSAFARSRVTLGRAFNERSSQRSFAPREIELADINLILRSALDNVFGSMLSISVLVQRASSYSPGVYSVEPKTLSLVMTRKAFSREQVEQLFLTLDYGDTPAIFWISGSVPSDSEAGQQRGDYQTLLLRAGFLGHRLWMAALGLGLGGTLIAGVRSGTASRSAKFTVDGQISLMAFLCGYAPGTNDESIRAL